MVDDATDSENDGIADVVDGADGEFGDEPVSPEIDNTITVGGGGG